MKLHKFHVDQFRARLVCERMTVAGILPTVAGDLVSAANSSGGKDDGFGPKNLEATAFAFITKRADDPSVIFQQRQNGVLHVNLDALMHPVVL